MFNPKWKLMGSRKWGGWHKESDYDFLVYEEDITDLLSGITKKKMYSKDNALGNTYHCYFTAEDKTYNFLVYTDRHIFNLAKKAVDQVTAVSLTSLGYRMSMNKKFRHTVVQDIFKGVFQHEKRHPTKLDLSMLYSGEIQKEVPYAAQEIDKPHPSKWDPLEHGTFSSSAPF